MKDNTITAATILGVSLIISSFLISSGLKALGHDVSGAGSLIASSIVHTNENIIKVD